MSIAVLNSPSQHLSSMQSSTTASNSSCNSPFSIVPLSRYAKLEKLGEGNYGCVYKARDRQTNEVVALKKIKMDDEDQGMPSTAIREIAILQDCKHPHIVNLDHVILEPGAFYLVFEYLDLDLRRYLDHVGVGLDAPLVKSYVYQLLLGVEFMHSRRHLHRDLKPQNLLIDRVGRLKLADLGLSRAVHFPLPPVTHEVATLWYRAPEILLGSKTYSSAVDLWSVGAIMSELVSNKPAFAGDSEIDTLFKIFQVCGTPSNASYPGCEQLPDWHVFPQWHHTDITQALGVQALDQQGKDLLKRLLCVDPRSRISARCALQHPYFAGFHPERHSQEAEKMAKLAAEKNEQRRQEKRQQQQLEANHAETQHAHHSDEQST